VELQRELCRNLKKAAERIGIDPKQALRHPEVRAIRRQVSLPFEYRAAARYCAKSGAELFLADSSKFSRKWIETWDELISHENLHSLLYLPWDSFAVDREYEAAARAIGGQWKAADRNAPDDPDDPAWQQRELFMARRIRELLDAHRPLLPLYVGGWRHLVSGDKELTLRDILEIEPSRCLLLDRVTAADHP